MIYSAYFVNDDKEILMCNITSAPSSSKTRSLWLQLIYKIDDSKSFSNIVGSNYVPLFLNAHPQIESYDQSNVTATGGDRVVFKVKNWALVDICLFNDVIADAVLGSSAGTIICLIPPSLYSNQITAILSTHDKIYKSNGVLFFVSERLDDLVDSTIICGEMAIIYGISKKCIQCVTQEFYNGFDSTQMHANDTSIMLVPSDKILLPYVAYDILIPASEVFINILVRNEIPTSQTALAISISTIIPHILEWVKWHPPRVFNNKTGIRIGSTSFKNGWTYFSIGTVSSFAFIDYLHATPSIENIRSHILNGMQHLGLFYPGSAIPILIIQVESGVLNLPISFTNHLLPSFDFTIPSLASAANLKIFPGERAILVSSALECSVPAVSGRVPEPVQVGISFGGIKTVFENVTFTYIVPSTISNVSPSSGSTTGGIRVKVAGNGLSNYSAFECVFGWTAVSAIYKSSTEIVCIVPAHAIGVVGVVVYASEFLLPFFGIPFLYSLLIISRQTSLSRASRSTIYALPSHEGGRISNPKLIVCDACLNEETELQILVAFNICTKSMSVSATQIPAIVPSAFVSILSKDSASEIRSGLFSIGDFRNGKYILGTNSNALHLVRSIVSKAEASMNCRFSSASRLFNSSHPTYIFPNIVPLNKHLTRKSSPNLAISGAALASLFIEDYCNSNSNSHSFTFRDISIFGQNALALASKSKSDNFFSSLFSCRISLQISSFLELPCKILMRNTYRIGSSVPAYNLSTNAISGLKTTDTESTNIHALKSVFPTSHSIMHINDTDLILVFSGPYFQSHEFWCIRFMGILKECILSSASDLNCQIDTSSNYPGLYAIELLIHCTFSVLNYKIALGHPNACAAQYDSSSLSFSAVKDIVQILETDTLSEQMFSIFLPDIRSDRSVLRQYALMKNTSSEKNVEHSAFKSSLASTTPHEMICDGVNIIYIPRDAEGEKIGFSCHFGNNITHGLSNILFCTIPAVRPGIYTLNVALETTRLVSYKQMIECLPLPRIFKSSLKPIAKNGFSLLDFSGLNIHPSTAFYCSIDSSFPVKAFITSKESISCLFPSAAPGFHVMEVFLSERNILFHIEVCLRDNFILNGGLLLHSEASNCLSGHSTSLMKDDYSQNPSVPRLISNSWPKIGPSDGFTNVEITAVGISYGFTYQCIFGNARGNAFSISDGRLLCAVPPGHLGNVSLSVISDAGNLWSGSWFKYFSQIMITDAYPLLLSQDGIIIMKTSVLPSALDDVYCHFGTNILQAFREGLNSLSCFCPSSMFASTGSISIGSGVAVMSNELKIPFWSFDSALSPSHGSHHGGTVVKISFPTVVLASYNISSCRFGGIIATHAELSKDLMSMRCVTPASNRFQNIVEVEVLGGLSIFHVGKFNFEQNVEVIAIFPYSIKPNSSTDLLLIGKFKQYSPNLYCHILPSESNDIEIFEFILPAKWLSGSAATCHVPSHITLVSTSIQIRASSNQQDLSEGYVILNIQSRDSIESVRPLRGFTSGGSSVTIISLQVLEILECTVGANRQIAKKVTNTKFSCLMPPYSAGTVQLVLSEHWRIVSSINFTYIDLPVLSLVSPPVLLANQTNRVEISGNGYIFDATFVGIFRGFDGASISGSCKFISNTSFLSCHIKPGLNNKMVILDLTVNGIDYKSNLLAIQVIKPPIILSIKPIILYSIGGSRIEFSFWSSHDIVFALFCRFRVNSLSFNAPARLLSTTSAECISPPLSPSFGENSDCIFSIEEQELAIYGPSMVKVLPTAKLISIAPKSIFSGTVSVVYLSFSYFLMTLDVQCELQGAHYQLIQLNSTTGVCSVQPLFSGIFKLSVGYSFFNLTSVKELIAIYVIDKPLDIIVNSSVALRNVDSFVKFTSPTCALPTETYCYTNGNQRLSHGMKSNCGIVCVVNTFESIIISLCMTEDCANRIHSELLSVVSTVNLITIQPDIGPIEGNTSVVILGEGFTFDARYECSFGNSGNSTPGVVMSLREINCVSPTFGQLGKTNVTITCMGIEISTNYLQFEYMMTFSNVRLNTNVISPLGGTALIMSVPNKYGDNEPFSCRFWRQFVSAYLFNNTVVVCRTPEFLFDTISFSLRVKSVDIFPPRILYALKFPLILFCEPISVAADAQSSFLFIADRSISESLNIRCSIFGTNGLTTIEGMAITCFIPFRIPAGKHTILLISESIVLFQHDFLSTSISRITAVSPLLSISSQSVAVILSTAVPIVNITTEMKCCFGEVSSPAVLQSSNAWLCYTPLILISNVQLSVPIGLAGQNGFCEEVGFDFLFLAPFGVVSVENVYGPITGGTPIKIEFSVQLSQLITYNCRIGHRGYPGQVVGGFSLFCVTRAEIAGSYDIEVSVNGADYFSIGHMFYFAMKSNNTLSIASRAMSPSLSYVLPNIVFAGRSQIISAHGKAFLPGCVCVIGELISLETKYISEEKIECVIPVLIPGSNTLTVVNKHRISHDGVSEAVEINLIDPATTRILQSSNLQPYIVSSSAPNQITIFGTNFDSSVNVSQSNVSSLMGALFCVLGNEWSYAIEIESASLKCVTPEASFSGSVNVRIGMASEEFLPGSIMLEYVADLIISDTEPRFGSMNSELLISGRGFSRNPIAACLFGSVKGIVSVLSDTEALCLAPELIGGLYSIGVVTIGESVIESGFTFEYFVQTQIMSLWPFSGPAMKGNSMITIVGHGFANSVDIRCNFDSISSTAVVISDHVLKCRTPSHRPGLVRVTLSVGGTLVHQSMDTLKFLYALDVSVEKVTPPNGYTAGGYAVFIFGSNFLNTSAIGCAFANMKSRGTFLSTNAMVCLAPSPLGRSELKIPQSVKVEVTNNGYDYSDSGISFSYSEPCSEGFFCLGLGRSLCPNGTFCPLNSRNFTLCPPGFFQSREGQQACALCPIGYICPDLGLSRPLVCPAGAICDTMGLKYASKSCPQGHYCLNGTKSFEAAEYYGPEWKKDYVSGAYYFDANFTLNVYHPYFSILKFANWLQPAFGQSRSQHPPIAQCDGLDCTPGGTRAVIAEAPYPCPIGYYCRTGVTSQTSIPKNYSTPQRCFDGFFCSRGSASPEGSGPCPTGYFCPTQLDALICPRGHYCPGVGNRSPVECYPGTYNPFEGKGNCTICLTGHICPGWGTLLPELCPPGYVCMSQGLSFPVVMCPQGYACGEGTRTLDPSDPTTFRPEACLGGMFCLGGVSSILTVPWIPENPYGKAFAQDCSEGTFCKAGAFSTAGSGLCFKGHYCPPKKSFPVETPLGNFATKEGSVAPTMCFPGSYAPLRSQVDCLQCPSGHTCQSYGTYKPSICPFGTFRSQVDSVTCRACGAGTFSYEVGSTDLSLCYPCPHGRVCGGTRMYSLSTADNCPAGFLCGYGTDRTRQFGHKAPGGFHSNLQTVPASQFKSKCALGYYCERGTSSLTQFRARCTVGYYCPVSTPTSNAPETQCPFLTSSLSGANSLQLCVIKPIAVCDKILIDSILPYEDISYMESFSYTALEFNAANQLSINSFDSNANAAVQTGEIQVVRKIHIVNETSSSSYWHNQTIEAFRACPSYWSGNGNVKVQIIGKNFYDTKLNFCKFRACLSANQGKHLRRCKNQLVDKFGEDLPKIGKYSSESFISHAQYVSSSRIECQIPEFLFDDKDNFLEKVALHSPDDSDIEGVWKGSIWGVMNQLGDGTLDYRCAYITQDGLPTGASSTSSTIGSDFAHGKLAYVRKCDSQSTIPCMNEPSFKMEYFSMLTFVCTPNDIYIGVCTNQPEIGYMMNPCMSAEVAIEVSNDGEHFSGGNEIGGAFGSSILSTTQYNRDIFTDAQPAIYRNFGNYKVNSTFAVFTYVYPEQWYSEDRINRMESKFCARPRYSEEGIRSREEGWFRLLAHEVAHVQIDLSAMPNSSQIMYNEHYKFSFFYLPSRCKSELCSPSKIRLSPQENLPCRKPFELPAWFESNTVPKNVKNNFTIYALDDIIFKVEIWLTHGLFRPFAPLFKNASTVRIVRPSRSVLAQTLNSSTRIILSPNLIGSPATRKVTQYVSFEEESVQNVFIFCVVYYQDDTTSQSQALNMPPRYDAYERGRVLMLYNTSIRPDIPAVYTGKIILDQGTQFWDQPASTLGESKEMLDTYFETFHGTKYDQNGYAFGFRKLLLPYVPYISNCRGYDKYIPFWMLTESSECTLPDYHFKQWFRYKYPSIPDFDSMRDVAAFDLMSNPISDMCFRTLECYYDEDLVNPDNTPRWFEVTGGSLFKMLRYPVDYYNYTGKLTTHPDNYDGGGQKAIENYERDSVDNFIPVSVNLGVNTITTNSYFMPRTMNLSVQYMLLRNTSSNFFTKRIILSSMLYDNYDTDGLKREFTLNFSFEALDWFNLLITFGFEPPIYVILFGALGCLSLAITASVYSLCRSTTILANPPEIKIQAFINLISPSVVSGVFLAMFPAWCLLAFGNTLLNGHFIPYPSVANPPIDVPFNPSNINKDGGGNTTNYMDVFDITYGTMPPLGVANDTQYVTTITTEQVYAGRKGRMGTVFAIVGICCLNAANGMYFPKVETKRERDLARRRNNLAEKNELWTPVLWKKANFMFWCMFMGIFNVNLVQMSYGGIFGGNIWVFIIGMALFGELFVALLPTMLQDELLCAPINGAFTFATGMVTFGSPDLIQFILADQMGLLTDTIFRIFWGDYTTAVYNFFSILFVTSIKVSLFLLPKYLIKNVPFLKAIDEEYKKKAVVKREVEGVVSTGSTSESVEPILDSLNFMFTDQLILFYMPFFVYIFIQFREQCGVPQAYNIRQSDMVIYMLFQLVLIPFQTIMDVLHLMTLEVYHGWKIYEYMVYSRYRFLQRETRWKGLEDSLDECISEDLRRVDQMCFSSQYYMMVTMALNGMIMITFAVTTWLQQAPYNPFSDPGLWPLAGAMALLYIVMEWALQQIAIFTELWKVKHENTSWHLIKKEEEDLDIPGWEDIKGASHEAYLMNQRITSETFRYKFLNYNRTWLINQLPQLLTPRTLRRSRPYLINQFARIINARRDDISDDSDKEDLGFGPVALTAPSRNIIRWWLGKARRRLRLKTIVDPLVRRARGAECEQCLSRKKLQIEYEVDVDEMAANYDAMFPGDEEVDQMQWKTFWMDNQRYHTICLACLTKRKEVATRAALSGVMDTSLMDDFQEAYPEWGPVYLTAASKAILLNWYRKAQRTRLGKRGVRIRPEKVVNVISDDDGEEVPASWMKNAKVVSLPTEAIAIKWLRTARSRLQRRGGKGASSRDSDIRNYS